jgi:hypothetical protein
MQFTIIITAIFIGMATANLHPMYAFPNSALQRYVLMLIIPKCTESY